MNGCDNTKCQHWSGWAQTGCKKKVDVDKCSILTRVKAESAISYKEAEKYYKEAK